MDKDLKPYLIEANSNPCLDTKGPVLTKLIRSLIDNVIMTAIDPLFPPPMYIYGDECAGTCRLKDKSRISARTTSKRTCSS